MEDVGCTSCTFPEWVIEAKSFRFGTPGRIRTCDLLLRRQPLYPSELQAHAEEKFTPRSSPGQGDLL